MKFPDYLSLEDLDEYLEGRFYTYTIFKDDVETDLVFKCPLEVLHIAKSIKDKRCLDTRIHIAVTNCHGQLREYMRVWD